YIGLAAATSMYFFFPIIINTFIMHRIYNGINGGKIFNGFIKILVAAVSSGICTYLVFIFLGEEQNLIIRTGVSGVVGVLLYSVLVVYVVKVREAIGLKEKVDRRIWS
ncbi:unnamed protein product, partial [marine sediment metagenome]